ncbi:MAG: type II secretion system protein GspM [Desulfobulbales bacterium]|nr:type II secretion system protein GspM [Desulfobulbales bacterium]
MSFWSNLQKREQQAVLWGGGIVLLLLAYVLVVAPLREDLVRTRGEVAARKADLIWMEDGAVRARQLKSSRSQTRVVSPLKMIDQTARRHGIEAGLKRVDPGDGDNIKVWFEELIFVDFMKFLRATGNSRALAVSNLTVEKLDAPGLVNARVTFKTESK